MVNKNTKVEEETKMHIWMWLAESQQWRNEWFFVGKVQVDLVL